MAAIAALFDKLLERGGSDLHLGVGYPPMLRIRGDLVPEGDRALTAPSRSFFANLRRFFVFLVTESQVPGH